METKSVLCVKAEIHNVLTSLRHGSDSRWSSKKRFEHEIPLKEEHTLLRAFKELHFFGTIWTKNSNQALNRQEQIDLLSRLLCIQEYGLFNQQNISVFNEKAIVLLAHKNICNPLSIYELFLSTMSNENKSTISCEQTPKNMYYLNEILAFFPQAKVINMEETKEMFCFLRKINGKGSF